MNKFNDLILCENCYEYQIDKMFDGMEVCQSCFKKLTKSKKRKADVERKRAEREDDYVTDRAHRNGR